MEKVVEQSNPKVNELVFTDEMLTQLDGMCMTKLNAADAIPTSRNMLERFIKNVRYLKMALRLMKKAYKNGDYVKMVEILEEVKGIDN